MVSLRLENAKQTAHAHTENIGQLQSVCSLVLAALGSEKILGSHLINVHCRMSYRPVAWHSTGSSISISRTLVSLSLLSVDRLHIAPQTSGK